jgi:hypothetical protein
MTIRRRSDRELKHLGSGFVLSPLHSHERLAKLFHQICQTRTRLVLIYDTSKAQSTDEGWHYGHMTSTNIARLQPSSIQEKRCMARVTIEFVFNQARRSYMAVLTTVAQAMGMNNAKSMVKD